MQKKKQNILISIYIFTIAIFVVGLLFSFFKQADLVSTEKMLDDSLIYGWRLEDGRTISLDSIDSISEDEIVASHILPKEIKDGDSINFNGYNLKFSVFIDGKQIYSYHPKGNLTGDGNGDTYHSIALSSAYSGKEITFKICPVYKGDTSSSFVELLVGPENAYYRYILKEYGFSFSLSLLIMFLGAAIFLLRFGLSDASDKNVNPSLRSIGLFAILIGLWSAVETSVPILIFGHSELWRALDYYLLPFVEFPLVVFVNSVSAKRKAVYEYVSLGIFVICFGLTVGARIILGIDLYYLRFFDISYMLEIALVCVILYDNYKYKKENDIKHDSKWMFFGLCCFILGAILNIVFYDLVDKTIMDDGFFTRVGVAVLMICVFMQILRNIREDHKTQNSNRFINELLRYSLSASSADKIMNQMIEYLGNETKAKRVYIFEEIEDGCFKNSYEWVAEGVRPEKSILTKIPFVGVLDTWFEDFGAFGFVMIDELEDYKNKSEPMYEFAKLLNIKRNVSGPLIIDGEYIGFFGIDDPTASSIYDLSYSIKLVAYFMAVMLRQRNNQVLLHKYSYRDQMTGVMNRRALEEYVENQMDHNTGIGVLMCDINGLKRVNDQLGHEAGDTMIRDVADCLSEVFTSQKVFRMGGDEFLAICTLPSESALDQRVRTLRLLIEARGRSASIGAVYGIPNEMEFEKLQKMADKLMYSDKRVYYEIHPDRRRRE